MHIEVEVRFLAHPVEVVEDAEPLLGVQLRELGAKGGKVGGEIRADTGEIGAGLPALSSPTNTTLWWGVLS